MIDQRDWMSVLEKYRGDAVVIPAYQAVKGWAEVSRLPRRDFSIDCPSMGKFSSIALGFALARSDTRVILMDGDGSLLMNLGTLVTIAAQAPTNFYHFVVQNGVYATTGGQALPAIDRVSFAGMARAAGYAAAYSFDDLEEFTNNVGRILSRVGHPDHRHQGPTSPAGRPRAAGRAEPRVKRTGAEDPKTALPGVDRPPSWG